MLRADPALVLPKINFKLTAALLLYHLAMLVQAVPLHPLPVKIGTTVPETALNSTTGLPLEARAPATSYKSAVRKGRNLWVTLNDPQKTKQSIWTAADTQKWGWAVKCDQNVEVFKDKTSGLEQALSWLQVSPSTSLNVRLEHNSDVNVDGTEYPATHAEYCGVYNLAQGILIASDRHSPAYRKMTTTSLRKAPLPHLQNWSDLTFLSWQHLAMANPEQQAPLRYIFVRGITNRNTQQLITEAMRVDGFKSGSALPWPNFWMFTPNEKDGSTSEPFLAVLGTENFGGIVFLLAQHQAAFGRRTIQSIRIWGDGGKSPVLHGMVDVG
ncbi:hypothetical protein CERZMDRAFT_81459 [Cercospora zeae-maydis SCOH1-5]|uniref:Fucose-specific lectin n=1 Tax=Cercospora zeae-maydis SCOH1-5 TaxID=717836 RepID=A0A6A6FSA3_9PEZI|nr:hypothetical protein CERZMDRAFT_81459 [Cercospora zeae-maydis SCOH1-5]